MSKKLKYFDVFVAGGNPRHTYNPRSTRDLEKKIASVKQNLCKLVVVTGHTKSGKTVLVQKVLPPEESVWIDGGSASSEDEFWSIVVDQLKLFQTTESEQGRKVSTEIAGKVGAEGGVILAKAKASASAKLGADKTSSASQSRTVSSKVTALEGLKKSGVSLVIDDFHYLPKNLQGAIIRSLKPRIFDGVPVAIIAIPHRRYDAIKVEREMTGRMLPVQVPMWDETELSYIPNVGFDLLKVRLEGSIVSQITQESIGSPHLTQEFCRKICETHPVESKQQLDLTQQDLESVFRAAAETIGRPIFEKLARGPRQRSDRKKRKLKNGATVDIYHLILEALAHIKPGLITLEYEELRTAIKDICMPHDIPNIQQIAQVLKHMSDIAATDQSSTPVIDFDEEEKRLHITDPFFAFFLKWGDLNQ